MTIYDEAVAQIPGYREVVAAAERARRLAGRARGPVELVPWGERVRAQVLAGEEVDLDRLREEVAGNYRALAARDQTMNELDNLARELVEEAKATLRGGVDDALRWLHERDGALMAEVRRVDAELGGVDSAEAAVVAGVGDLWAALLDLVARWDELRKVQNRLLIDHAGGADNAPSVLVLAGIIRDGVEVWPVCRFRAGEEHPRPAWPSPAGEGAALPNPKWGREWWVWPTADRPAYLRWLAARGSTWVPTVDELTEHAEAMEAEIRRARYGEVPVHQLGSTAVVTR